MIVLFPGPCFRDICIHVQRHFPRQKAVVVSDKPIRGQLSNGLDPDRVRVAEFKPNLDEVYVLVATGASSDDTLSVILRLLEAGATFRICATEAERVRPGLYPWQIAELDEALRVSAGSDS